MQMYRQLPNALTLLRLVLAAVFFIVLNQYRYNETDYPDLVLGSSIALFLLAAGTDWLDGYLARRWEVESKFGRIMDPFCDKVLVIGAFVYLAGPRFVIPERAEEAHLMTNISGVYPWMVAVILARELLVTAIRGEIEHGGAHFGATMFGKAKMILQSVTIPIVLAIIWLHPMERTWLAYFRDTLVYLTIFATIVSGLPYLRSAYRALQESRPPKGSGESTPAGS